MPADWCPFCIGSGQVPDAYDVLLYPNDFPAFSPETEPFVPGGELYKTTGARGQCDVVLYSPDHRLAPSQLTVEQWAKVVDLWTRRTQELSEIPDIAYCAIFENCGEAIGVTMPHPHGQIYATPFVPPIAETELRSSREFAEMHDGNCLSCRLLAEELRDGARLVAANRSFVAFIPFAARFPAEIHIYSRRHLVSLRELSASEKTDLADIISRIRRKYDNLYGFLMPLMMVVKQAPLKEPASWFHFQIQFLPLQRSATKLKYLAGVESGFGLFLADTTPEEKAAELRAVAPE